MSRLIGRSLAGLLVAALGLALSAAIAATLLLITGFYVDAEAMLRWMEWTR